MISTTLFVTLANMYRISMLSYKILMKENKDVNKWKDSLFSSCTERLNIIKTVLSKLVYRFNVISIELKGKKKKLV